MKIQVIKQANRQGRDETICPWLIDVIPPAANEK